ncbi:ATP-dependent zinc metalloprotease FtsH [Tropicimonas isoalkanivorans]|uniref:ATP-dependent zinc metalloprotease FtsH n=1 Tax=Tropicimonas isoalkanivorans TaxID=441112 RepID=A0A1I1E6B7_9RHOB|nr:ATP-dependent zinc metalloprotease FtsH [Tropicimonas isoalkanivorans]SFB82749.1 cell division protease FtsH [Tropicimonas isoalkanivorans]
MARDPSNQPPKPDPANRVGWSELLALAALLFMGVIAVLSDAGPPQQTLPYSELKQMIRRGDVNQALLEENAIRVSAASSDSVETTWYRAVTPSQGDPELLPLLEAQGVEITAETPRGVSIFSYLLPWLLILGVYVWYQRRMMERFGGLGSGGMGGIFTGRFATPTEQRSPVTFADVAGQDQAKKEVAELVEFLREPERFGKVGAEVPHGVLLMGPPGTGKTLLARALAGEAEVPFFSTSGSEFIEVFVGVGAGRVRRMFEAARNAAPAVIFIDELDSIGRTRGTGLGGGHDEREQTLNQILAELDGFGGKEAVVVLAATNRPDVLDPALLRPGRFDRHVILNLPDKTARRAILDIHARDLPLADPADLGTIAEGTPGFSGADLKNLLNEAAIQAARRRAATITGADLQEARDKVMMGTVRTLAIQPEERHRLAVHEAGHTAAAYYSPGADPLYKVTIIPRGRSLGGTHMLERDEHHTLPEDYLNTQLIVLLAGRAAEKRLIGTVSSGADDDIKRATALARSMVARWGMTEDLGPVDLRQSEDQPFLGQTMALPREHADETAARVDSEVMALLKDAEAKATGIIAQHEREIRRLIDRLEASEVLDADEIEACLAPGPAKRAKSPKPVRTPPAGDAGSTKSRPTEMTP